MRKLITLMLAIILLLSALSANVSASGIKVLLSDKEIVFPDAQPYKNGTQIMIPIRHTAEALGMKANYHSPTKEIHLLVPSATVAFKVGGNSASINGGSAIPFDAAATYKQGRVYVPLTFFKKVLGLHTAYNTETNKVLITTAAPSMEKELPTNIVEEEVIVGAGTPFALKGTLTMPKNASGPLPALVLVHGSGPSDRDETAGGYKPFRDIAWGLAEQGVAVLRYEKRTFAHVSKFTPEMLATFTVKEETIDDAIAASKLLKSDKRIDSSRVYVAGHSLGGMMAPRIDAEGGDFAGLIILAGTIRSFWEISHDQNEAYIEAMDDNNPAKKANAAWLAAELVKAQSIVSMTEAEAMSESVFSIPAYYLRDMDIHDTGDLVAKLNKPILVLQGSDDFQVYADKDYILWQEALKDKPQAALKLYPGLNHFFVDYDGKDKGTIEEYKYPGSVDQKVIKDMASWILNTVNH